MNGVVEHSDLVYAVSVREYVEYTLPLSIEQLLVYLLGVNEVVHLRKLSTYTLRRVYDDHCRVFLQLKVRHDRDVQFFTEKLACFL